MPEVLGERTSSNHPSPHPPTEQTENVVPAPDEERPEMSALRKQHANNEPQYGTTPSKPTAHPQWKLHPPPIGSLANDSWDQRGEPSRAQSSRTRPVNCTRIEA
eukprot:5750152-Amphidinium_carterae.1